MERDAVYDNKCFENKSFDLESHNSKPSEPARNGCTCTRRGLYLFLAILFAMSTLGCVVWIVFKFIHESSGSGILSSLPPDGQSSHMTPSPIPEKDSSTQRFPKTSSSSIGPFAALPRDCWQAFWHSNRSGVYDIKPVGSPAPFEVYCDMENDGGGWTVFQRRIDGYIAFYRRWSDYKNGFGLFNTEFWLGNEKLFYLTAQRTYELMINLEDFEGNKRYALYSSFRISGEAALYTLNLGVYNGNGGDSLSYHNLSYFSTKDADNDEHDINCAFQFKGGWWYHKCQKSNLNGYYLGGEHTSYADGINWFTWHGHHYSLKSTEMKIRPVLDN